MSDRGWMTAEERKTRTFKRECGVCNLCCKLLPVDGLHAAGTWCQHAVKGKGCGIYPTRPGACQVWACLWLAEEDDKLGLRRPDKCHFVIDEGADVMGVNGQDIPCIQVWIDPAYPTAWRQDAALRQLILAMAEKGVGTMLRNGPVRGRAILAPPLALEWTEMESQYSRAETTQAQKLRVLGRPADPEVRAIALRDDHITWARRRALEYVELGQWDNAVSSLISDLGKQEGCGLSPERIHELMTRLVAGDHDGIRTFIREVH